MTRQIPSPRQCTAYLLAMVELDRLVAKRRAFVCRDLHGALLSVGDRVRLIDDCVVTISGFSSPDRFVYVGIGAFSGQTVLLTHPCSAVMSCAVSCGERSEAAAADTAQASTLPDGNHGENISGVPNHD